MLSSVYPSRSILILIQRYQGLMGLLILLIIAFLYSADDFFSNQNFHAILNQVSIPGMLSLGITFVILTGGIDLSLGSHLALLSCILANNAKAGIPLEISIIEVCCLGIFIGGVIGWIICFTRLQPFIVSLAAMVSLRGVCFIYTNNTTIVGIDNAFKGLDKEWLNVPLPAWMVLGTGLLAFLVLKKTVFGRYVYAIGGNEEASRLSGIPITSVKIKVYAICGFYVALTALLFTARTQTGQPSAASGYELDAIAAAVVGGCSLSGGYGFILSSLIGALFIVCVNTLFILRGINFQVGMGWKGIIILGAVYLQNIGRK